MKSKNPIALAGGRARMASMTPEERIEHCRAAGLASAKARAKKKRIERK